MVKKISKNQLQGTQAENDFKSWITRLGCIPQDFVKDHGIDFICQVIMPSETKKSYPMPGNLLAVSVRSTDKSDAYATIDKSDAELLLQCSSPIIFVIADMKKNNRFAEFYVKFIEFFFIEELIDFIKKKPKNRKIKISECISDEKEISKKIIELFLPGALETLNMLKRQLKVKSIIPGSSLRIIIDPEKGRSVIMLNDFIDQFDLSSPEDVAISENMFFGSNKNLKLNISKLKYKQDFSKFLTELPSPIFVGCNYPNIVGSNTLLFINSHDKKVSSTFEIRKLGKWVGYCHSSGLFLKISECIEDNDGRHIHKTESGFDPSATVDVLRDNKLLEFLKLCVDEKAIIEFENSGLTLPIQHFSSLCVYGWFAKYYEITKEIDGLHFEGLIIKDISEEDLQSLRLIYNLKKNISCLDNWGFRLVREKVVEEEHHFKIPLCMNFRKKGLVCWLVYRS